MSLTVNFYNTGGYYYNSSGTSVAASSHYYAYKNRRWRMDITAAQMALIPDAVKSASVRVYNKDYYNSEYTFYFVASKEASWSSVLTDGNYFGKTDTQSLTLYPTWSEFNLDCSTCFQYAQENWPGEAWYLWCVWTKGGGDKACIGYNNTSYASWRCPYFTIVVDTEYSDTQAYVFKEPTTISYPTAAMTAETSQNCTATASSTYSSSYPAWRAFDKSSTSNPWASSKNATGPWLQLQMPQALYNITITITNRNDSTSSVAAPLTGEIWASNDGSTYTQIGSYDRSSATSAGASTSHSCGNQTAYSYVKVYSTTWNNSGSYAAIGELGITGTDVPTGGGFVPVEPYVFNGSSFVAATEYVFTG